MFSNQENAKETAKDFWTWSITMQRSWNEIKGVQRAQTLVISLSDPMSEFEWSNTPRPEDELEAFLAASAAISVLWTARTAESIRGDASNGVIHVSGTICSPDLDGHMYKRKQGTSQRRVKGITNCASNLHWSIRFACWLADVHFHSVIAAPLAWVLEECQTLYMRIWSVWCTWLMTVSV